MREGEMDGGRGWGGREGAKEGERGEGGREGGKQRGKGGTGREGGKPTSITLNWTTLHFMFLLSKKACVEC